MVPEAGARQQTYFDRLGSDQLDVVPPSASATGAPGEMSVRAASCKTLPLSEVRRRIVDIAVQEWAYFGFSTVDYTVEPAPGERGFGRRRPRMSSQDAARVADSIAGYWAATAEGSWIVERQNDRWNGPAGVGSRWGDPWSAAFVSWVMCEGGLGDRNQFRRAIAHVTYIDQAIRSRDGGASQAAFTAYDAGETDVVPGDLVCAGTRPNYRSLSERRRQLGEGARTHCDIVVQVDEASERFLVIGGNVRGTVSLKLLGGVPENGRLRPVGRSGRPVFAHLKLRADAIAPDALNSSPTMEAISCSPIIASPLRQAAAVGLAVERPQLNSC